MPGSKPRSHIITKWSTIVQVIVVLKRTVLGDIARCFHNLSGSHLLCRVKQNLSKGFINVIQNSPSQAGPHSPGRSYFPKLCTRIMLKLLAHAHVETKQLQIFFFNGRKVVLNFVQNSQEFVSSALFLTYT